METSDIIALVLIAVVGIAAMVYFIIKSNGKTARVRSILKDHPSLVMALLNSEKQPSLEDISDVQSETILSLTDSDWDEWEDLKGRVLNIAEQYPYTLHEFINEHFPKNKERIIYKKKVANFTPIPKKVKHALNSLLLEELQKINLDSEATWKQRDELRLSVSKIKLKFPEGFKSYCSIHKSSPLLNSEIVGYQKHIAELQKLYDDSKGYEGWEKKQDDFCSKFWQMLKDGRSQDGRYTYDVSFKKPNRKGSHVESHFKVWQGFCGSFSSFLIDKQTSSFLERYNEISEFKNRERYFYDSVYDDIFEIINKFNEEIFGDLYVILIDRCKLNWDKRTYDYHYAHIRELIDNSDSNIQRFNFCDLPDVNDNGNIGGVFVLDFVTSNEELKNNCKLIIEHFSKSVPFIGYYSMKKEYDEDELKKIAENQEGYLVNDDNPKEDIFEDEFIESVDIHKTWFNGDDENTDTEFIKNSILRIKKHPFFSYMAIPNTWIGKAYGAESTKRKWLDNPELYLFKTNDKEGRISGEYSVDGGKSYEDISIEGNSFNIDDVALFTYQLLEGMGVFLQFKQKGDKAIVYMNSKGFLAHH